MKLPGPTYSQRGQSSFGRDPTDPTQVSRALFAAAQAEAGVGTAEAEAAKEYVRAASARGDYGSNLAREGSALFGAGQAQSSAGMSIAEMGNTFLRAGAAQANAGAATAQQGAAVAGVGIAQAHTGSAMANTGEQMVRTGSIMFAETTAQGQISKAIGQTADVLDAWDKSSDAVRANTALAKYVGGTTDIIEFIKNNPAVKRAEVPDRWLKKKDDEREVIPTWEIAPAMYDERERELYKEALSGITRIEHRQELAVQLTNKKVANSGTILNHYVTEKRKDELGKDEEAIRDLVQKGQPASAIWVIERSFEAGTINMETRVKKIAKVWHDDEDLNTARLLANTDSPGYLRRVADGILQKSDSYLSPDERRNYANSALAKAEQIAKQDEAIRLKMERDASKRILGELGERIRLHGYIPMHQDLMEAQKALVPADYLALLALVDRKDGNGQVKSDPASVRELNNDIMALGKPDSAGIPNHMRADVVMDKIMLAYANNKLEVKDREQMIAMLERYRDRSLKKNPEHAQAEDLIEANILPPKGFMQQFAAGELTKFGALSNEMKIELNEATRKDPKLDSIKWVRDNLPRYKELSTSQIYASLFTMGLGTYARVSTTDQKLDITATRSALDEAFKNDRISERLYKQAVNALATLGQPVGQTKGRGK